MADGFAQLDEIAARLKAVGEIPRRAAPAVARVVRDEVLGNVAKTVDPYGRPWAPTKDGNAPLQGTAKELTVTASGATVVARLEGVHARHHSGEVRGGIARPILPTGRLPSSMGEAIAAELERAFDAATRGT